MKTLYPCDPSKNHKCSKGSCFINNGPCSETSDPDAAVSIDLIDYGIKFMPERAHDTDAGADVFALYSFILEPGGHHKMVLDFGVAVPPNFAAYMEPKGSTGSLGLLPVANAIDAGYRGPVSVDLWNVSNQRKYIDAGMKIAQLVIKPVVIGKFTIKQLADIPESDRGTGAYGSSGTHHE